MHAFVNEYIIAIERFEASYKPHSLDEPNPWNAYVDATIAFLEGDLDALLQREILGEGDSLAGSNRTVVDKLVENFGKPYSEAYRKR